MWIDHVTLVNYLGDRAHPEDPEATTEPPAPGHIAELEQVDVGDGEATWQHTGWASALSLAQLKAQRQLNIRTHADMLRSKITQGVSPAEAGAWSNKEGEAVKVKAGAGADQAPMLAAEASARRIPLAEVANRVVNNANAWRVLEGTIAGVSGFHRDQVAALETVAAVLAYDYSTHWPEVGG